MPAAVAAPALASWVVPTIVGGASAAGSTIASIYGAKKSSSSANRAAQLQTQQNNYAADLEAKAAADALKFARESEATRRSEFDRTQTRNREMYDMDTARREPFRQFSLGALAGLGKPLYPPGSIRSMVKG